MPNYGHRVKWEYLSVNRKTSATADKYLDESEYPRIVAALHVLSAVVSIELHHVAIKDDSRHLVIRNFVARAQVTLESILHLYDRRAYGDCWTLFRTLDVHPDSWPRAKLGFGRF